MKVFYQGLPWGRSLRVVFIALTIFLNLDLEAKGETLAQSFEFEEKTITLKNFLFNYGSDKGVSTNVGIKIGGHFPILQTLKVNLKSLVFLNTSQFQEDFPIYQLGSGFFISEASLSFLQDYWDIRIGAVNQDLFGHSLASPGLPAASIAAHTDRENWGFGVGYSLLSNYSSNLDRIEVEGSSSFSIASVYLKNQIIDLSSFGIFSYQGLSSKMAHESRLRGNTGTGATDTGIGLPANASFIAPFQGFSLKLEDCFLDFCFKGNWIQNTSAPSNLGGRALFVSLINTQAWGELSYTRYFIDDYVLPAVYGPRQYGYSDKIGHKLSFAKDLFKQISVGLDYTHAKGEHGDFSLANAFAYWSF